MWSGVRLSQSLACTSVRSSSRSFRTTPVSFWCTCQRIEEVRLTLAFSFSFNGDGTNVEPLPLPPLLPVLSPPGRRSPSPKIKTKQIPNVNQNRETLRPKSLTQRIWGKGREAKSDLRESGGRRFERDRPSQRKGNSLRETDRDRETLFIYFFRIY